MLVLDTNVVSALMQPTLPPAVAAWMDSQVLPDLFITTVSQAEIFAGIEILPSGRRRQDLGLMASVLFEQEFSGRFLPFCSTSARNFARFLAERRRIGRPAGMADMMIAAIACTHRAPVITRDVAGFAGIGIEVVNPWHTN